MFEQKLQKMKEWLKKNDFYLIAISILICGIVCHFDAIKNDLVTYDGYWNFHYYIAGAWEMSLGRFLIPYLDLLYHGISSTYIAMIMSLYIYIFITIKIINLLHIQNRFFKVLIAILLIINPTFSYQLLYPYTAIAYSLSMFFAVLSADYLCRKASLKNGGLAILFLVLSLGIYQAYFSVVTVLWLIYKTFQLITEPSYKMKEFFKDSIYAFLILLGGLIIYYAILQLFLKCHHLILSDYSGANNVVSFATIKNIPHAIKEIYKVCFCFYFQKYIYVNHVFARDYLYFFLFLIILINYFLLYRKQKLSQVKGLYLILLIFIYPLMACSLNIFVTNYYSKIGILMASSLNMFYLIIFKQMELLQLPKPYNFLKKISIIFIVAIYCTFYLTNLASYILIKQYNSQMYNTGNQVLAYIENKGLLKDNSRIILTGNLAFNSNISKHLLPFVNFDIKNFGHNICGYYFINYIAGEYGLDPIYDIPYQYQQIVANLDIFPSPNSIFQVDNLIIVKIGN